MRVLFPAPVPPAIRTLAAAGGDECSGVEVEDSAPPQRQHERDEKEDKGEVMAVAERGLGDVDRHEPSPRWDPRP